MTKRTTVKTVGPVDIVLVEAEMVSKDFSPDKYNADCTECGWGVMGGTDIVPVEVEAQNHLDRNHEDPDVLDAQPLFDSVTWEEAKAFREKCEAEGISEKQFFRLFGALTIVRVGGDLEHFAKDHEDLTRQLRELGMLTDD